ncbi:hypothetical protein [Oceanobacillus oncorhynchi]|nr:hypothetical protein [Oceanobacillus oncorhynchi]UUI39739.1 hypothetical protein NP440_20845 [Oceanobacillus oncorhynchi]
MFRQNGTVMTRPHQNDAINHSNKMQIVTQGYAPGDMTEQPLP